VIPHVRAKGKASVRIADILNRMEAEEPINSSDVIMHYSVFSYSQRINKSKFMKL